MIGFRQVANRRTTRLVLALALVVSVVALRPSSAGAYEKQVTGRFTASAVPPLVCTGISCFATDFTGGIQGHAEHTLTNLMPSTTPAGVLFFNLLTVIHTGIGDIFCGESGASNPVVESDGEFVLLCEITGGTGAYAGVSGYLMRTGTSVGGLVGTVPTQPPTTGGGEYRGVIRK